MGDFNRVRTEVDRWLRRTPYPIKVMELREKDAELGTREHGSKRTIDHMVSMMAHPEDHLRRPRVIRKVDISDHYPLVSTFRSDRADAATPAGFPVADGIGEGEGDLDELDRQAVADAAATRMVDTAFQVAKAHRVTKLREPKRKPALKASIARAIDDRGKMYRRARKTRGDDANRTAAWAAYEETKKTAERLVRQDRRKTWTKALQTASAQMRTDPKAFWKFSSDVAGWKRKDTGSGLQPVKHPDTGVLMTGAADISASWKTHYERLASDVTGNSRSPDQWVKWTAAPQRPHLASLDEPITMPELNEALLRLKRHKASGRDGLPADFLKLAAGDVGTESPMAKALLGILNLMWKYQIIPEEWQDSTVVSIPKKGDVADMNNYRGISLMSTVLKVLVMIISTRLNETFEEHNLFSHAQAGFRKKEECVTQAACLLEIAQRRKLQRKATFLMFVDLKKAYDTVPHEALFAKLDFYGVRGNMLGFIRKLYANSRISVRTGDLFSETFGLKRGVRQGCPLSPVLFNIFINDILDGTETLGVPVSGNNVERKTRVSGLLFADDLVAIASTRNRLAQLGDRLTKWLQENEMSAGIHKCGVMAIGVSTRRLSSTPDRWKLAGANLPIVREYTYLGLVFNRKLDVEVMMGNKLAAGARMVSAMAPFLRCRQIPVPMRVAVVRGVILPRLLFGAEVYGMRKAITHRMQLQMNKAFRLVAGVGASAAVSNVALWRELDIPPICASAAARRARALQKASSMKTWVATMVNTPFKHRRWTWCTGTHRWMNRYIHRLASWIPDELPDNRLSRSRTAAWYIASEFADNRLSSARTADTLRLLKASHTLFDAALVGSGAPGG
ncbi:unnamed protein product [Pylaiella littoralis]